MFEIISRGGLLPFGVATPLLILFGALMLVGLVILHELGHFYAARKSGVEVEEFGIGFPPKAKTLGVKNGTEYTLNWLPLGGFVRLKGEHDSDTGKGTYGAASLKNKVKIMVAGVIVNAVTAVILLSIVAAVSLPQVLGDKQFSVASDTHITKHDVVIAYVLPGSPAEKGGISVEDKLLSFTPEKCETDTCQQDVKESGDVRKITPTLAGQTVIVKYKDASENNVQKELRTSLLSDEEIAQSKTANEQCRAAGTKAQDCPQTQSYFGVVPDDYIEQRATWSAPIVGVVFSAQIVQETFVNFGTVIAGLFRGDTTAAQDQVTGVLGIGYILSELASRGFMSVLFLTAVISLSLAIMNVLPIPALDGGRLFVTLIFRFFKKPLTKELEEKIHGSGFAFLMVLFLLVTFLDVKRFILN